jgi:hypothetical protein
VHLEQLCCHFADMDIQLQQLRHNTSEQNGTNSSSQNKGYLIYIMPASDVRLKNQVVIGTDCAAFVPHVAGNDCPSITVCCFNLLHVINRFICI